MCYPEWPKAQQGAYLVITRATPQAALVRVVGYLGAGTAREAYFRAAYGSTRLKAFESTICPPF